MAPEKEKVWGTKCSDDGRAKETKCGKSTDRLGCRGEEVIVRVMIT
jgi:hypothetical protein